MEREFDLKDALKAEIILHSKNIFTFQSGI